MATFDTDVDVDDMMWSMSSWEKQEMADALYDEGIIPKALSREAAEIENRWPAGHSEQELSDVLDKIWNNKMFINSDDIQNLTKLSKKGLH